MVTASEVMTNFGTSGFGLDHAVFLQFAEGNNDSNGAQSNRIMLKAESINIDTSRNVPQIPIPFSGTITGESTALSIDMGIASKRISIQGIITDQFIKKNIDGTSVEVHLTSHEVAQLIHSAVDSSAFQKSQNLSRLFILYPSRVGDDYEYRTGLTSTTPQDECPLVPFDYKSRALDASPAQIGTFAGPTDGEDNYRGITGVLETFGTSITPGQPFISFDLSFTQSFVFTG
jgi:hypothetical protein